MQVATAQEALFMACEMESSAIQLYTRALSLMEQLGRQDEPLYDHLTLMLADEQEHLHSSARWAAGTTLHRSGASRCPPRRTTFSLKAG